MSEDKQWKWLAIIMMSLSLFFGFFYLTMETIHGEEEGETTTETTTVDDEKKDTTIVEVKQTVEDISTKIDKVNEEIESQKVDSEKIKEQAAEIELLKEELEGIKAVTKALEGDIPGKQPYGNPFEIGMTIPINTNKRIYIYELSYSTSSTEATGALSSVLIASNTDALQIIYTEDTINGTNRSYLGIANLYSEDGKLQPIVGINSKLNALTLSEIKAMLMNPDNWGYFRNNVTEQNYKFFAGYYNREGTQRMTKYMIVPSGYDTANQNYAEQYNATVLCALSTDDLTGGVTGGATGAIQIYDINKDKVKLEIIETVRPPETAWTVEQIYTPILVIMSVLVIMLFKKR